MKTLKAKATFCIILAMLLTLTVLPVSVSADFNSARLSPQNLTVDGETIRCEKYNINGNNYFKLRDLAFLLSGTGSQFSVGWDEAEKTVSIVTGEAYIPNDSELELNGDQSATAMRSAQRILINGVVRDDLSVYNIGGCNYFKLRDLGSALNFEVNYDAATNTAEVESVYSYGGQEIRYVYTTDELVECLRSNTLIYLAPGEYNLTDWVNGVMDKDDAAILAINPGIDLEMLDMEGEIRLNGVENLTIVGAGSDNTSIVVEPRYANVLAFADWCLDITLRGLTLGHTPEQGYCTGNVLYFEDCDNVTLYDLDLYGCGIYGIAGNCLSYATVKNCTIHDCSYGALDIEDSYAVDFINCTFRNNGNLDTLYFYSTGDVFFDTCVFTGNVFNFVDGCGFIVCGGETSEIDFYECTFGSYEYESLMNSDLLGSSVREKDSRIV